MQLNEANIQSMGQTARTASATQGNKPQGPFGIVPDPTAGPSNVEQKNANQLSAATNAATNGAKTGPATNASSLGVTTGQASGTGLISGQMMSRRI